MARLGPNARGAGQLHWLLLLRLQVRVLLQQRQHLEEAGSSCLLLLAGQTCCDVGQPLQQPQSWPLVLRAPAQLQHAWQQV
jgi:hypothetical protein